MRLAVAAALIAAMVLTPTGAHALSAAPSAERATNAAYYGDRGSGRASRTDSAYIGTVARILSGQNTYFESACTVPHAAVVLDVDDTMLSTYDMYVGAMHYRLDRSVKNSWVRHEKFTAVPGMVAFAKRAKKNGCRLVVISGRASTQKTATLANLAKVGYPGFSRAYFATAGSSSTTQQFKSRTRARLERAGVVIVANVGDQRTDLSGGHAARDIRLPNRMYTIP